MPDANNFLAFIIATLILLIIPGPAVLFVVGKSIDQGRTSGIVSVLGIAVGTIFHIIVAAYGISLLLTTSEIAFNVLKYLGATYLIYLGLTNLFSKGGPARLESGSRDQKLTEIFYEGVLVNVLNPKTALFIFSFIPQFVSVDSYAVETQILFMGLCFILMGIICDGTYAVIAAELKNLFQKQIGIQRIQKKVAGTIYLLLGIYTLTLSPGKMK